MSIEYKIGNANQFSTTEIEKFKKIVIEAGEVDAKHFDGLIKKNPILIFVPNTLKIEAVGALKIPNLSYKNKVFSNSKSELKSSDFKLELGWIVCINEGKGIGKKITDILSSYQNENIYATTRKDNLKMQHILNKYGFNKSGISYNSSRGKYENTLFIKHKKNAL